MNKRIEELAVEAGMIIGDNSLFDMAKAMPKEVKFAKLIIKECMSIVEEQRMKILKNPNDPSWTEHLAEVKTNIEQHFGVE